MKLYQQLILFVVAATVVPLLVGFFILRHNEQQLVDRMLTSREDSAVRLAEVVQREMREVFERLQAALGYFDVEDMSEDELSGFLGILYKQSEDILQVALLSDSGRKLAPGVYLDHPERYPEYAGRLGVSDREHEVFLSGLPLEKSLSAPAGSVVVGRPEPLPKHATLGLSVVVPWTPQGREDRWLAAVQLSLAPVIRRVAEVGQTRGWDAVLVDEAGRVIDPGQTDLSGKTAVARMKAAEERGAFFEQEALHAFSRVSLLGWGVVISQSRAEAWAEVRRARRVTLAWTGVSILALLLLGSMFTGRITRNLRRFVASARELAKGNLDARVELKSRDELGVLAETFNHMGSELKASREEIEEWNRELTRRVEERTRELAEAHRRLLETSKLAAIGQLGAGVAHEINNPLVGILGNVQLMMMKAKDDPKQTGVLQKVEAAAKRCKDITQNLLRFSEQNADAEHVECDLAEVLQNAFSLTEQQIFDQGIETIWQLGADLPPVMGDHRQLMQVFLNLFANARTAMPAGGKLHIVTRRSADGMLEVSVQDSGRGIAAEHLDRIFEPFFTTKDVWTNTGLGLSVAFRIVSDHGGRIRAESLPGKGSRFLVQLPVVGEAM